MAEAFPAELIRTRRLSDSTMDFRFKRTDGKPVVFEPGEFFRFSFTDSAGTFERPYSLCNFTDASQKEMDLVISTVDGGRASEYLFHCDVGIEASVTGPYGRMVLPAELPQRLFMVATSVGIAPFLPMLDKLNEANAVVMLLFGVRDRTELLYADHLLALSQAWPNLSLVVCYSRKVANLNEYEKLGYVTDFLDTFEPNSETDRFLLCGNPRMIDECYGRLKALGFSAKQVIREKYVFTKDTKKVQRPALTDEQKNLIAEKLRKHPRQSKD
ncbi:MAG TPA: hypothetical protein DCM54_04585 [Gammaproteobacteria bacterium]|nr:hypothetical protein [Gammaproteobacteria bacterium]|tara:strand:- start:326 stop:1138 length:813 start_codon:yes stop_codon:yes gene_type:complete